MTTPNDAFSASAFAHPRGESVRDVPPLIRWRKLHKPARCHRRHRSI